MASTGRYTTSFATPGARTISDYRSTWRSVLLLQTKIEGITSEHITFLKFMLIMFKKSKSDFVTINGEDWSLNRSVRKILDIPL